MVSRSIEKLRTRRRTAGQRLDARGFTLAEALVTVAICLFCGLAAFETNQRLLFALKSQKETTASIMVLQQRKEALRAMAFTDIATASTLQSTLQVPTASQAPLANLNETVTVSLNPADASYTSPSPTPTVLLRNHQNALPQIVTQNNNISSYDLLPADILLTWMSANSCQRSRQSSELFGHGNIGQ